MSQTTDLKTAIDAWVSELKTSGSVDDISADLTVSYNRLHSTLGQSADIVIHRLLLGKALQWRGFIAYVTGMVNPTVLDGDLVHSLQYYWSSQALAGQPPEALMTAFQSAFVGVGKITQETTWSKAIAGMMQGNTLFFLDGVASCLLLDTAKIPSRSVSTVKSEPSVKGPQEAFIEVLGTQMALLRSRLPTEKLRFHAQTLSQGAESRIALANLEGVTNPSIVHAVAERLKGIEVDSIQSAQEVAEFLADRHWTIFPQVRETDRVDMVARSLNQGKVAVLVANDPFVLILPNTLMDYYQTSQDYAMPCWDSSLVRLVRFVGLIIGLYLMPLYIALTSINPDLLPIKLILTLAGSRENIPIPPSGKSS
ncbi:spore germination protein [Sulfobacillus sp. DSM 109850]|uniref:Spore germination protein n=1 Tax=Sulfobacillus harzensis TaxID=2729629 RepID=A0A7Y0L695_9FIRM|nr:spore germination protein [Sulfobacillus harzensis]